MIVILAALVLSIAAVTLYMLNDWRIEFTVPEHSEQTVECLSPYDAPKVTAMLVGNIFYREGKEVEVTSAGEGDTGKVGEYKLSYSASAFGVSADCERTVTVVDTTAPVITLIPDERAYIIPGTEYDDPGFSAADNVDGDITDKVVAVTENDTVTYTVSDNAGNVTTATRQIPYGDPVAPVITLKGSEKVEFTRAFRPPTTSTATSPIKSRSRERSIPTPSAPIR